MSDPINLAVLREAVDAVERTVDDHLDWIPPWRTFAQQALIEAAAHALLEGEREWRCRVYGNKRFTRGFHCGVTSNIKHQGTGCGWVVVIPVSEEAT